MKSQGEKVKYVANLYTGIKGNLEVRAMLFIGPPALPKEVMEKELDIPQSPEDSHCASILLLQPFDTRCPLCLRASNAMLAPACTCLLYKVIA